MSKGVCYFGSYDPSYSRNRIIIKGLRLNKVDVFEINFNGLFVTRFPKLIKSFLKQKDNFDALIVGFPGWYDVLLAFLLGRLFRKKILYDMFISTYETYVIDREVVNKGSLKAFYYYALDWVNAKMVDRVIVDTITHAGLYKKLFQINSTKITVIYLGSDNEVFNPSERKQTTDVFFYGSFQPLQGVEKIAEAAYQLPEVSFKIVGEGQTKNILKEFINNKKIKNIKLVGWESLSKLAQDLNSAKLSLGIFGEGLKANSVIPNKVYDTLACGKPIITKDTSAVREILKNGYNSYLVKTDKELVNAIKFLLNNEKSRDEIAKNGFNMIKTKFTPQKVVGPMLDAI